MERMSVFFIRFLHFLKMGCFLNIYMFILRPVFDGRVGLEKKKKNLMCLCEMISSGFNQKKKKT